MSKLERKNHKVFGINATETKVGQFGSANATTKITTKDVEKIQALDAWEQGWEAGAVGNNRYPTQQERTGVDYEHSYQIGYMLQEGVPEWNKDTTYNKGSIVKAYNGTTLQNYVSLVDDNLNNAVTDNAKWKSGLANSDLSNLTTTGEKHFLNKSQITNCLLEVPQRIKYTLVDGTLTIKAGSVVIVPYGTENKTADLPKGATFINENFKVYDTQFSDGKFFVWAELVNDLSDTRTETDTKTRFINIYLANSSVNGAVNALSGTTISSSALFYNTSTNLVDYYTNGVADGRIGSLPIGLAIANNSQIYGSVQQVFNGMGYIGSTIWVDKGVKGLCPNGRNADGSLINEEVVTDKFIVRNLSSNNIAGTYLGTLNNNKIISLYNSKICYNLKSWSSAPTPATNVWAYVYIENENNFYYTRNGSPYNLLNAFDLFILTVKANNIITSFAPKLPFRVADENDIDGKLQMINKRVLDNYNLAINATRQVDLYSVLPNDGEIYECRFAYQTLTGYNQMAFIYQQTDVELQSSAMWRGRSFSTGASMQGGGTFIAYVGEQRYIKLISTSASSGVCNIVLDLRSYRKVGK